MRSQPQIIRTVGSLVLAGFAVVLLVSVTTIARHDTGAYLLVMATLAGSLALVIAMALLAGWLLSRMREGQTPDGGPSSELERLRTERDVLRRQLGEGRPAP